MLWLAGTAAGQAPQSQLGERAKRQIAALWAEKSSRSPAQRKMSSRLVHAAKFFRGQALPADFPNPRSAMRSAGVDARNFVEVEIRADVTPQLLSAIAVLGGNVLHSAKEYGAIHASVPLLAVEQLAGRTDVQQVRAAERSHKRQRANATPAMHAAARKSLAAQLGGYLGAARPRQTPGLGGMFRSLGKAFFVGPNISGDIAHQGPSARSTFSVTGAGVKIGVVSDGISPSVLAAEQAAGRLPAGVTILPGFEGSGDEGTALMEIIYTLAPGASLYFASGDGGRPMMASAMQALADAGCKIILDDLGYSLEGVYQHNQVGLKTDELAAAGVLMITAAGNLGNSLKGTSGVWEGNFVGSPATGILEGGGTVHNFAAGVTSDVITETSFYDEYHLAWSDPNSASNNDYDLFILNSTMTDLLAVSDDFQDGTQDPAELIIDDTIPIGSRIVVGNYLGAAAPRALFVNTNGGTLAISTSGSIYGHPAAAGAISVAAVSVTSAGGGAFTGGAANPVRSYSADGPRRMFYNADGTAITPGNVLFPGGGLLFNKPDFAAADGVPTGITGYNPFFGTSAAAPHIAAIVALMVESRPSATLAQVRSALQASALDIEGPGFDVTSGYGIAMASAALTWVTANVGGVTISSAPDTGLGFNLSGIGCNAGAYVTPMTFQWPVGANCTVQWLSPVFPTTGLRYVFTGWHDSSIMNPRTFTATAGVMNLTGTFEKSWQLTTQAASGAGGLASPGTNFFLANSPVTLTATANVGFAFTGWSGTGGGSYSGQALNPVVSMTSAITQTANFVPTGTLGAIGSLPHIATGDTWKMTMTGLNLGASAAPLRMTFLADNGSALALPLTFPQSPPAPPVSQSIYNTALNPNAQIVLESTGAIGSPVLQGSGRIQGGGQINGYGIFSYPSLKWEAVVPLENRNASRYVMAFDNTGTIATGLAIANGVGVAALVPVTIRDHTGAILFSGTLPLAANGHTSFMLAGTYPVTVNKRGTIEFQTPSGGQIGVMGLRANGSALTTLPVMADVGASGGSLTHILYHGGFTNGITLVNMGTTAASSTLSFFSEAGAALTTPLRLPQTGETLTTSSFTRTLAPGASILIETVGDASLPVVVGSAELTSTGNVSGFGIFLWTDPGQEASVPVEDRDTQSYVLVFDNTGGLSTGLALTSFASQPVGVTIRDDTGGVLLSTSIALPAHGHTSFMLPDTYPVANGKRGTIEFTRTVAGKISVIGLRATPGGNLTTIPVITR